MSAHIEYMCNEFYDIKRTQKEQKHKKRKEFIFVENDRFYSKLLFVWKCFKALHSLQALDGRKFFAQCFINEWSCGRKLH